MRKTKIEWCDATWNPVTGCFNDCPYCYARKIAERFRRIDDYAKVVRVLEEPERIYGRTEPYPYGFSPIFYKYKLDEPKKWKNQRNIFVCSMADLFAEWIPDDWIDAVFRACEESPWHKYLFLTKNPARYVELYIAGKLPMQDNMWYGTTITNSDSPYVSCMVNSHNLFLSIEPIMEYMGEWSQILKENIKWVIVGAETGNRKGKVTPEKAWIDKLAEQCSKYEVPIFMKDSLVPIVGEENMRREFPKELLRWMELRDGCERKKAKA